MTTPLIIDTDTHFTETPDLWVSRLPKSWGDQVMHVVRDEKTGGDVWVIGDRVIGGAWSMLAYGTGRIANSDSARPKTRDEVHPATWDQAERVKVMDQIGIRAAVLYPNFAGLNAKYFRLGMASNEIAEAHLSAYNDAQYEWSTNYPGRFIPMIVIPFWDVAASVREIERLGGKGFGGIVTTAAPQNHGEPPMGHPHWNPIWQACTDLGLSVSFHIGSGNVADPDPSIADLYEPGTHLAHSAVPFMIDNARYTFDLLLSGVMIRYPKVKFVSVESGLGWVPFVLEAADYHFKKARRNFETHPWDDLVPSDLFHRQMYVNYWFEKLDPYHLEMVGVDNILFETDFPHRTCLEKDDVDHAVGTLMANVSDQVRERILWKNACEVYRLPEV